MLTGDEDDDLKHLRFEDIQKFLRVYSNAADLPEQSRTTFQDLFKGLGALSTTQGQLARLCEYLFSRLPPKVRPTRGPGLELLFDSHTKGGPLQATHER